jgi:hypothetical protein
MSNTEAIKNTDYWNSTQDTTLRLVYSRATHAWKWSIKLDGRTVSDGLGTKSLIETIRLAEAQHGQSRHLLVPATSARWWRSSEEMWDLAAKEQWTELCGESATEHLANLLGEGQCAARRKWQEMETTARAVSESIASLSEHEHAVISAEYNAMDSPVQRDSQRYYEIAISGAHDALEELANS